MGVHFATGPVAGFELAAVSFLPYTNTHPDRAPGGDQSSPRPVTGNADTFTITNEHTDADGNANSHAHRHTDPFTHEHASADAHPSPARDLSPGRGGRAPGDRQRQRPP